MKTKTGKEVPQKEQCNFYMDGNKWCCTEPNHIDLQSSPAGFGDTQDEAYQALVDEILWDEQSAAILLTDDEPFKGGHNED